MKKTFFILTVVMLLAVLPGCKGPEQAAASQPAAEPSETVAVLSVDTPAPSVTVSESPSPAVTGTESPSLSPSPSPSGTKEIDPEANKKNKQELKKQINNLEDELKELKDLFNDINFDGLNDF